MSHNVELNILKKDMEHQLKQKPTIFVKDGIKYCPNDIPEVWNIVTEEKDGIIYIIDYYK
jgi:hypothetical protein